jgi:hypothetical protein
MNRKIVRVASAILAESTKITIGNLKLNITNYWDVSHLILVSLKLDEIEVYPYTYNETERGRVSSGFVKLEKDDDILIQYNIQTHKIFELYLALRGSKNFEVKGF